MRAGESDRVNVSRSDQAMRFASGLRWLGAITVALGALCIIVLSATYPDCNAQTDALIDYVSCQDDQNAAMTAGVVVAAATFSSVIFLLAVAWVIELLALVTNNSAELIESMEDLREALGRGG